MVDIIFLRSFFLRRFKVAIFIKFRSYVEQSRHIKFSHGTLIKVE